MPSTDDEIRVGDAASPSTPSKQRVSRPEFATPTSGRDSEPRSSASIPPSTKALEERILVTGRGRIVTDIPRNEFQKSFLSRLKQDVDPSPRHAAYFQITECQEWGEQQFYENVLKSSMETMCADLEPSLQFHYHPRRSPAGSSDARPDFLIAKSTQAPASERVHWRDLELVMGHSSEIQKKPLKFSQWLRDARTVFHQQPHRRFCFGIIFLKPDVYLCYADHGCAAFSEPLKLTPLSDGSKFLVQFLTSFLQSSDWQRGRDPDILEENDTTVLTQGERRYLIREDIYYSVAIVGRNLRVFAVQDKSSKRRRVCKSVWEEIPGTSRPGEATPDEITHDREFDVIKHLQNAQVRGLPEVYDMQHAQINDPYATTASFPAGGKVLKAPRKNALGRSGLSSSYLEQWHTQLEEAGAQSEPNSNRWEKGRQRRLYRFVMSECQGLRAKINQDGFGELLPVVRDAMICYYECYKIPDPGQLQADISDRNIMATTPITQLTGLPSDPCPRKGTIIDWNLSYKASGLPTSRQFRSGTPAFMAVDLLDPKGNVQQRTLKHDLESFFAVILYMTLSHDNPKWQRSSFAQAFDTAKDFKAIYFIKASILFRKSQFKKDCLDDINTQLPGGSGMKLLLEDMRSLLYPDHTEGSSGEGLFREMMDIIDMYLRDDYGRRNLMEIDARKSSMMRV